MADEKKHYNAAGTHVWVLYPNGEEWECPDNESSLNNAFANGAVLCEPRDRSFDGLYDPEVLAAKLAERNAPAPKKASPKSNTTSGD